MDPQAATCPNCHEPGILGAPCSEKGCLKRGYHFIPSRFVDPARSDPEIGRLINERYLLVKLLGEGGFGRVFQALQMPLAMAVALKLLKPDRDDQLHEQRMRLFRQEAVVLSRLQHPNIVRIVDFGIHERAAFLVMELLDDGATLKDEVRRRARLGRPFGPGEIAAILTGVLHGLAEAHTKGLIHRDIKPDNIILQEKAGHPVLPRILDFGLAKFVDSDTQSSAVLGTPMYMAPEQLTKKDPGPWTDLYALGVITYELLTSRRPFLGEVGQVLADKRDPSYDVLAPIADLEIPEPVRRFLARALACDPADRYRSTTSFGEALATALGHIRAHTAGATRSPTPGDEPTVAPGLAPSSNVASARSTPASSDPEPTAAPTAAPPLGPASPLTSASLRETLPARPRPASQAAPPTSPPPALPAPSSNLPSALTASRDVGRAAPPRSAYGRRVLVGLALAVALAVALVLSLTSSDTSSTASTSPGSTPPDTLGAPPPAPATPLGGPAPIAPVEVTQPLAESDAAPAPTPPADTSPEPIDAAAPAPDPVTAFLSDLDRDPSAASSLLARLVAELGLEGRIDLARVVVVSPETALPGTTGPQRGGALALEPGTALVFRRGRYVMQVGLSLVGRSDVALIAEPDTEIFARENQAVLTIQKSRSVAVHGVYMNHHAVDQSGLYRAWAGCDHEEFKVSVKRSNVIDVLDSKDVIVQHSDLEGSGFIGVRAVRSTGISITDTVIHDCISEALRLESASVVADNLLVYRVGARRYVGKSRCLWKTCDFALPTPVTEFGTAIHVDAKSSLDLSRATVVVPNPLEKSQALVIDGKATIASSLFVQDRGLVSSRHRGTLALAGVCSSAPAWSDKVDVSRLEVTPGRISHPPAPPSLSFVNAPELPESCAGFGATLARDGVVKRLPPGAPAPP